MSVRPVLLKDIRRIAISHQQQTGKGNYNRFAPLERNRTYSTGKRQLSVSDYSDPPATSKTPKLDANLVFEQLKEQDGIFAEAKILLATAEKTGEDAFSATDGGIGTSISCLTKVLTLMLKSQENLTSVLIDSAKLNTTSVPVAAQRVPQNTQVQQQVFRDRSNSIRPPPVALSAEEAAAKKVKQAIKEAEKKTLVFNLDLGMAPTMNKDNLSRKVTMALSAKCAGGKHDYHIGDAEEVIDDLLSCSKLEFLGTTSRMYHNNREVKDPATGKMVKDPLDGKMCTLPVRFDFKDKETRIQAEMSLRKICQVKCTTPYPKKLRALMKTLVDEGKKVAPENFIRTRVNADKLCIDVHAKVGQEWKDLCMHTKIPLDILDSAFVFPRGGDKHSVEQMEEESNFS